MKQFTSHERDRLRQSVVLPTHWDRIKKRLLPLIPDDLLAAAMRRTGLEDFGDPPYREALHILADACNTEAGLSLFGQLSARQHLLDLLETRLRLVSHWKKIPDIQEQTITQPIFITGLPRSGSTFLHDLFSLDPGNRVPRTWEVMFPLPNPTRQGFDSDPRIARAEKRLRWLRWIRPALVKAHPIGARLPQECVAITSFSLQSDEFLCMFQIPSYEKWLRTCDLGPAYDFHRRFLRHLQWLCPGERWVLKAPDHVHSLSALLEIYPDARIVFLHRDPLKVLGSVASLATLLKGAFSSHIDPLHAGADEARILEEKILNIMEFQDRHPSLKDRFINIRYTDSIRDPIATVQSIYNYFGITLSTNAETHMRAFLNSRRNIRRPKHVYRLADFGIDPGQESLRFAGYYERFAIERETL